MKRYFQLLESRGAYLDNKTINNIINNQDFLENLIDSLINKNNSYKEFIKGIEETKEVISIGTFAKVLSNNNINIGRNRLFFWFRENGYLIKNEIDKNLPKQKYIDSGYFKVIEKIIKTENGEKLQATTRITGKKVRNVNGILRNDKYPFAIANIDRYVFGEKVY
ncbi:phage antirepressor KilAC domain-containing protein [[Eubacterium] tenue]|nr:phage antirepressor KilAC domain-containing protein [[Eubacterium] tenue]MBC8632082.1 phage antirepressor KilAC domain-containing protein [[Eubacterium] tenue]